MRIARNIHEEIYGTVDPQSEFDSGHIIAIETWLLSTNQNLDSDIDSLVLEWQKFQAANYDASWERQMALDNLPQRETEE